jgi:hypothetical protein
VGQNDPLGFLDSYDQDGDDQGDYDPSEPWL